MTSKSSARRRLPAGLAALLVATGALACWFVLAASLGAYHVAALRSTATDLQQAAQASDAAAVSASLADLERHAGGVGRWLGGAPWTWLAWLPGAGGTIEATTTLAQAVDAVASPLAPAAANLVQSGTSDMTGLAEALDEQSDSLTEAGRNAVAFAPLVAAIDAEDLLGPVAGQIGQAQQEFADAVPAVTGLAAASVLVPGILGIEEPTPWVLVASQPAEARGSGAGFFGAFGVMEGDQGSLRLVESRSNNEVFNRPADLSVLPPEFAQLWGESAAYIWGHNLTRHFPYAATLLAQTTAAAGVDPAYVVALDPAVVAALLELTGPVTAAGVTIDATTAQEYLTGGIYQQFPDGDEKDRVALELMSGVLVALQSSDVAPVELIAALAEPLSQQRLVAWAADPAEQEVVEDSQVGGAVPSPDLILTAAINNAGGNKLDAYLVSGIAMTLTGQCEAVTSGTVQVTLELADVPPGLPDYVAAGVRGPASYGSTRLLIHLYGPPGASLSALLVNSEQGLVQQGEELGRPVWGTQLDLLPDTPASVTFSFEGMWPQQGPVGFLAQPMVQETMVTIRDERVCQ